jgi:Predicted molecular chaperone distantly related to HSP70-fold metalloproteases
MNIGNIVENIDNFGIDGDFIESQAFAYLAIRSFLNLPISFPKTTGCKHPSTGGKLVNNFLKENASIFMSMRFF